MNDNDKDTHYQELFEANPHPMLVYDPDNRRIRFANRAAAQTYGYTQAHLCGLTLDDLHPEEQRAALRRDIATVAGPRHAGVWTHRRANNSTLGVEITSNDLWISSHRYRVVVIQPVTARRETELREQRRLQRTSKQQSVIARLAADPLLGAGTDPGAALARICFTASEALYVRRASFWRLVGTPPGLAREQIYDAATAEHSTAAHYIDGARCPGYIAAVQSGRAIDAGDARNDHRTRELAGEHLTPQGIAALLGSSVRLHGQVHGILCLEHAGEPRLWLEDEIRFAGELANQAAQALLSAERERHRRLVHFIASGVAAGTGLAFFRLLVKRLGENLGATRVHIAKLADAESSTEATIIAGWRRDGAPHEGSYALEGTPCAQTIQRDFCIIPERVAECFPDNADLARLQAQGYLGVQLHDSQQRLIGLLVAVFDQSLESVDEVRSLMQIFAVRAASELERMHGEARLRLAAEVLENASEGILVADEAGLILECNPAYLRMTKKTRACACGDVLLPTLCGNNPRTISRIDEALARKGHWEGEIDCKRADGNSFPAWLNLSRLSQPQASSARFIALLGDITEIRESQAELHHLAHHDPLTGLPNRLALRQRLERSLAKRRAEGGGLALLFIDLDGFKDVNDSLGHTEGDEVLKIIARRLEDYIREDDLLARVGGDEFMLLLGSTNAAHQAQQLAQRLIKGLDAPFAAAGRPMYITASIGIATAPAHGDDSEALIRAADAAMYLAKAEGRNTARMFQPELSDQAYHRIATAGALRTAIDEQHFYLEYQSVMDLEQRQSIACEALVRWRGADGRTIPPAEFIPIAERSGLIVPMSRWIFSAACQQMRAWLDAGTAPRRIAVNVSPLHFQQGDLIADLRTAIGEAGIEPHHLIVEVTESMLMLAPRRIAETLAALRAMNVGIAVDDFGTGYSSLAYLKRLPLSILKLDRAFTRDLPDDTDNIAISRAILRMAESLGLEVIAEGIETEAQLTFLRGEGCRLGQGFLFGPATAAETSNSAHQPALASPPPTA